MHSNDYLLLTSSLLLLPLSLILVHLIGWHSWHITAGTGMHSARSSKGDSVRYVCDQLQSNKHLPMYCESLFKEGDSAILYMSFDPQNTADEYFLLDKFTTDYWLSKPQEMLSRFFDGLRYARNFPTQLHGIQSYRAQHRSGWFIALDVLTWAILILGLLGGRTRLLATFGLGLWVIPAIGNIVAEYYIRYHKPMAGIPLATAMLILWYAIENKHQQLIAISASIFLLITTLISFLAVAPYLPWH